MPDATIERSETGEQVATILKEGEEIQRTVLEETLEAARQGQPTEAGRTVCGTDAAQMRLPWGRFPRSIQLDQCPRGAAGVWHTHTAAAEFANPQHSIPDWANVIFHGIDASMVVGHETSEVVVAAKDRQQMIEGLSEAIGVEVTSREDVTHAIRSGEILEFQAARQRVRTTLAPLVERVETTFPDVGAEAAEIGLPAVGPQSPSTQPTMDGMADPPIPDVGRLRARTAPVNAGLGHLVDRLDLKGEVLSVTVGTIVGTVVSRVLFGEA